MTSYEPQEPVRGRPRRRKRTTGRLLALGVILLLVGVGAWIASAAVRGVAGEQATPAADPTTVAVTGAAAGTARASKPLRIIFPEGFTRKQMAARIAEVNEIAKDKRNVTPRLRQARYLALTEGTAPPAGFGKVPHLEGFLFPATYEFLPRTTTKQLLDKQLDAFRTNWAKVDMAFARSKNLTPYDVLIIASMVERETVAPDERPLVASVIYNRLKAGMPLGIDATIRYGLDVPGTEPLRQSHLNSDNPYNTRNRQGLPPTPIANPGLASLQAAAHPAETNYLYFVRKPDKVHHFFTASEAEFYRKACEYGYGC